MNIGQCVRACWAACCEVVEEIDAGGNTQLSVASTSNCDELPVTQQPGSAPIGKREENEPLIGKSQFGGKKKPEKRVPGFSAGMQSRLDKSTAFSKSGEVDPDDVFTDNALAAQAYDGKLRELTKAQEKLLKKITHGDWTGGDLQLPRLKQKVEKALGNNQQQQVIAEKLLTRAQAAIRENILGDNQDMEGLIAKTKESQEIFKEQEGLLEAKKEAYELDIVNASQLVESDVSSPDSTPDLSRSVTSIFSRQLGSERNELEDMDDGDELGELEDADDDGSLGIVEDIGSDEDEVQV